MSKTDKAILALADGTVFEGEAIGAAGDCIGEIVFNTSMTGYQEILTDPSYKGQIVTMTYPLIGNYGVNKEDVESSKTFLEGFIVKELCTYPQNWRSEGDLNGYLKRSGVVGIQGIDTRALTRHIRDNGAQQGIISTDCTDMESLVNRAKSSPGLIGRNLVKEVACEKAYKWEENLWQFGSGYKREAKSPSRYNVVAYDLGIKYNILRSLINVNCDVTVCPPTTSAEEVLSFEPDGIFLSNGPGDPEGVPHIISNVIKLLDKKPIFGICLGHQILSLALGGKTYKLKFGHHGGNHPVMDLSTNKVEITVQNHGFVVDLESLKGEVELTHINLNDNTVEGISHKSLPLFSVQYHPEASPGPKDAAYLFKRFVDMMEGK